MANARKQDGLEAFHTWLVDHVGKAHSTAKTYVSSTRAILRIMRAAPLEPVVGVADAFATLAADKPRSIHNYRTSWRAYVEWMRVERGIAIESPPADATSNAPNVQPLPEPVREGLRAINRAGVSFQRLKLMLWADVDFDTISNEGESASVLVRDPMKEGTSEMFSVPFSAIVAFQEYGQPGTDYTKPLVPLAPGSSQPYPQRGLLRESKAGQESIEDRVRRLRQETMGGPEGSPLGPQMSLPAGGPGAAIESYKSAYLREAEEAEESGASLGDILGMPDQDILGMPVSSTAEAEPPAEVDAVTQAAALLGMSPEALRAKMEKGGAQ